MEMLLPSRLAITIWPLSESLRSLHLPIFPASNTSTSTCYLIYSTPWQVPLQQDNQCYCYLAIWRAKHINFVINNLYSFSEDECFLSSILVSINKARDKCQYLFCCTKHQWPQDGRYCIFSTSSEYSLFWTNISPLSCENVSLYKAV